jgi:hypothetical protein
MRNVFALAFALVSMSSACGDDDGTPSSSGVESQKSVDAISDGEAQKLCEFGDAVIPTPSKTAACTAYAVFRTSDRASCEDLVSECERQADVGGNGVECEGVDNGEFAGCTAKVAEFEECLKEAGRELEAFYHDVSCAEAGHAAQPEPAAACQQIKSRCPQAFNLM